MVELFGDSAAGQGAHPRKGKVIKQNDRNSVIGRNS